MNIVRNHWLSWTILVASICLGIISTSSLHQRVNGQALNDDHSNNPNENEQLLPHQFPMEKPRMITVEELAKNDGQGKDGVIWLSILGEVYDVTKGAGYYAKGAGYEVFAARDGSVPFITGNFTAEEAEKPILEVLTDAQLFQLEDWRKFYMNEERYPLMGLLLGYYYDENGAPTEERNRVTEIVNNFVPLGVRRRKEREEKRRREEEAAAAAAADEGAALNAALDEGVDPAKSADKGEPKRVYAKKEYVSDEAAVKKGSLKRGGVKGVVTPNQGEL